MASQPFSSISLNSVTLLEIYGLKSFFHTILSQNIVTGIT